MHNSKRKKFNTLIFSWFLRHGRDLPWRRTRDPYKIFISEMMLQQTQVDRVFSKYQEFLRVFPTKTALADASLGAVLRAWSGLGYNRRARYLWESIRVIQRAYNGRFPTKRDQLLQLPGIGNSTASAVLSFAFGKDEPMIDTNVRRVLTRVFFKGKNQPDSALFTFAKTILSPGKGREWNWAVMDIGALYCKAAVHENNCPIQKLHGKAYRFQYKKPQTPFKFSNRYYRGEILRLLSGKPRMSAAEIRARIQLKEGMFQKVVSSLKEDRLLKQRGPILTLP